MRKAVLAVFAAALLTTSVAQADILIIETGPGNDCPGAFGQPFEACSYSGSPVIAKYDFPDEDGPGGGTWDTNLFFPTIDGSEWSFEFFDDEGIGGAWTYVAGPGDPAITHYSVKFGNNFHLYANSETPDAGGWFTGGRAISHIVFYDTGGDNLVPEPGLLALLGLGLVGVGRRFRR